MHGDVPVGEIGHVIGLGLITLLRVAVLIALASLIWVPIGVWVGHAARASRASCSRSPSSWPPSPRICFSGFVVSAIVLLSSRPDIWLSPLMILGTQWYILFNVIVGASAISPELRYAGENFGLTGWLWWRRLALPAVFPFYVTGAITAAGGSWNASIVAEVVSWGNETVRRMAWEPTLMLPPRGGLPRAWCSGIVVLSLFVVTLNRLFWRPLYARAERKFRMS